METRKIQLAGGSTYTVSLPKRWATEHGIETGGQVWLSPNDDGSLVVRPRPEREGEATTVRINADDRSPAALRRTVLALYVAGIDEFTLSASGGFPTDRRRVVTRTVTNLIGLEAVEETDHRIVLRSLLDPAEVSIRQSVLQLQFVALAMYDGAVAAFAGEGDHAEHVVERDDEADRLFALVNRHFQRTLSSIQEVECLGVDRPTLFAYYTTARQLERVADHAERIAATARRFETRPPADSVAEIIAVARRSHGVVADAASVLLGKGSVEEAYRALDDRDRLIADVETADRALYEGDVSDSYLLALVLDSVARTAEYGGNVAETAIQASLREN